MLRRIHAIRLQPGLVDLDPVQARHARLVLRLEEGTEVEVFDDAGRTARGLLVYQGAEAAVRVEAVSEVPSAVDRLRWTVAAAVPKGDRADWMVEKLSELGTEEFIPLATARSVVLPEGRGKRDRWTRIATEAAKQSRRPGVMRIGDLTTASDLIRASSNAATAGPGWFLSTEPAAIPIQTAIRDVTASRPLTISVGPEGGWTDAEIGAFGAAGWTPVKLTDTVLRVETAAVTAAAILATDRR